MAALWWHDASMTLLTVFGLLLGLGLFGLMVYLITKYIPMSPGIKTVISVIALIVAVLIACSVLGVWDWLGSVHVGPTMAPQHR